MTHCRELDEYIDIFRYAHETNAKMGSWIEQRIDTLINNKNSLSEYTKNVSNNRVSQLGALQGGISPRSTLKSRRTSYVLVPPTFTTQFILIG